VRVAIELRQGTQQRADETGASDAGRDAIGDCTVAGRVLGCTACAEQRVTVQRLAADVCGGRALSLVGRRF
jgi:hypothetical protein